MKLITSGKPEDQEKPFFVRVHSTDNKTISVYDYDDRGIAEGFAAGCFEQATVKMVEVYRRGTLVNPLPQLLARLK